MRISKVLLAAVFGVTGFYILGAQPATAQADITQGEFMEVYEEAIGQVEGVTCLKPLPDSDFGFTIGLDGDDCGALTVFLDNAYEEYRLEETEDGRQAVLERYINVAVQTAPDDENEDLDALRQQLVVQIRSKEYAKFVRSIEDAPDIVVQDFYGDLDAVLMKDSEEALSTVDAETLETLGISVEEAFAQARANLPRLVGEIYEDPIDEFPGIIVTSSENSLASGLLFQDDFCTAASPNMMHFPFERYQFLSVRTEDVESAKTLLQFAQQQVDEGESLSNTLLFCDEGELGFGAIIPNEPSE